MNDMVIGIFIGLGFSVIGSLLTLLWQNKQVDNTEFEEELEIERKKQETFDKIKVVR